jgi:M6 family metalloprotease-like protein/uncharacterized repeat protein (TIGR01451 family)
VLRDGAKLKRSIVVLLALLAGLAPSPEQAARADDHYHLGTEPVLVLLVDFTDQAPVGSAAADWQQRFFGASDSVADYYDEVSYGLFTFGPATESHGTADDGVVGWLTLPTPHPDPAEPDEHSNRVLTADAIEASDPFVDYASYDADEDGLLSTDELHIVIVAAGHEAAYGGKEDACGPSVVGYEGVIGGGVYAPTLDGTVVGGDGYSLLGEWHCTTDDTPGHMATLGLFVHLLGYELGWPDLGDPDGGSEGAGDWSLMAEGYWLATTGPPGSMPAHPDAFSKTYQGWVDPLALSGTQTALPMRDAATHRDIVRLGDNPSGVDWIHDVHPGTGEYFLIENRNGAGYDAGLPGCGLLIWHVDETLPSTDVANNNEAHRLVDLEEADGLDDLDHEVNYGDDGDPFPGSAPAQRFDAWTYPSSDRYDGTASGSAVRPRGSCSATMHVDLTTQGLLPSSGLVVTVDPDVDAATPSDTIAYDVSVKNVAPADATDLRVEVDVPDGISAIAPLDAACALDGDRVVCETASLDADQTESFSIEMTVSRDHVTSVDAVALAHATSAEPLFGAAPSTIPTACTIVGKTRGDELRGTKQADVICGRGGRDEIDGRGGDDVLIGGSGNDRLRGGRGSDLCITGGDPKDRARPSCEVVLS